MKLRALFFTTIVILLSGSSARFQEQTESQRLAAQALTLIEKKQYADAAKLVERVVKIERNSTPRNNKALGTALVNLARVKDAQNRYEVSTPTSDSDPRAFLRNMRTDEEIESHYAEALKSFDALLPTEADAWTTVVLEWGDFLHHDHGFSFTAEEFHKIEKHYVNAIDRLTRAIGPDAALTFRLVVRLADVYDKASEYERALPLYERFVKANEGRSGDRSALIHALRQCLAIHTLAGQTPIAEAYARQISQITGGTEKAPQVDLTKRTEKSYVAEMMSDPSTITTYTKTLRTILITVEVDEKGNVVEASTGPTTAVDIHGKNVRDLALKQVRSWKFRPLSLNGPRRKMFGYVSYAYLTRKT